MTAHAHAAHLETSTGLDNRKLAIWTFIGSECMFFATLISNYLVNKDKSLVGPFPHEPWTSPSGQHFEPIFEIPLVTLGTALLLFSSLFVVLALSGAQRGNRKALLGWLAVPWVTRALAPTMDWAPMSAPSRMVAPIPMRHSSSTVQA